MPHNNTFLSYSRYGLLVCWRSSQYNAFPSAERKWGIVWGKIIRVPWTQKVRINYVMGSFIISVRINME
jgi:hypothetical protein